VVQQCAPPDTLYERPQNAFVADFIGENNFIRGEVAGVEDGLVRVALPGGAEVTVQAADIDEVGAPCIVSVRPEKIASASGEQAGGNTITAKFDVQLYVGDFIRYYFELADGTEVTIKVLNDLSAPRFGSGESAWLTWQASDSYAFRTT
jgi:putative spermidine/putrescine transport system ATP-binding protein